ncbi:hypothetical protein [Streptomyces piniterrae]|uniref:hypothetical protein n=1 Tax=Streptomyces piniterrae TaxID=2571125 RepID=UPI001FE2DE9F|nr:hypothetical protein [Streptomyces piniterrae]
MRSATGDPALADLPKAQGRGVLDGGLLVRTPTGEFQITELEPALGDELASGTCTVNGVKSGGQSLLRCSMSEGRLVAEPAQPGRPLKVRLTGVPVRPTEESLKAFTTALGASPFTVDSVLGHLTAEGTYTPPRS